MRKKQAAHLTGTATDAPAGSQPATSPRLGRLGQSERQIKVADDSGWEDYALMDTGQGRKLERFGGFVIQRPEVQALWRRALPATEWDNCHAIYQSSKEEAAGRWQFLRSVPDRWPLQVALTAGLASGHKDPVIRFWAKATGSRHVGVFPEGRPNWLWLFRIIARRRAPSPQASAAAPVTVLNLFGYTGLATLVAASAGASVTHVDASRTSIALARENQVLSGLQAARIRWIIDDAMKFVQREARRGARYDGIILDPPKFGRGPKGEVWELYRALPTLLDACRGVLSDHPLFALVTVYAVKASAIHVAQALEQMLEGYHGKLECGELAVREQSAGRLLSQAVYARWCTEPE